MTQLPRRTKSLDDLPEALHEHYREHAPGQYFLELEPDPDRKSLEAERDRYKHRVHQDVLDKAADDAVAKLCPDGPWRPLIRREVRAQLRIDDDGERIVAFLADENGKQRETPAGLDMQASDLRNDPVFKAEYGPAMNMSTGTAKPGSKTPPAKRIGRDCDVVIAQGSDQVTFERAFAKAAQQGGEVIVDDSGSAQPSPASARDVQLSQGHSQHEFEAAYAKAAEQGGEVRMSS